MYKRVGNYLFFIDCETSGSCPISNGIIRIVLIVTTLDFEIVERFDWKIRPPTLNAKTWSNEAEKIHGVSYNEVLTYMNNREFCIDFLWKMKKYKHELNLSLPFICHASNTGRKIFTEHGMEYAPYPWFDYNFLLWCFKKEELEYSFYKLFTLENCVSTIKMARDLKFKSNRLSNWAERLNFNLNHHDPMSDTLCCIEVFKYLLEYEGRFNEHRTSNEESKAIKKPKAKRLDNNLSLEF